MGEDICNQRRIVYAVMEKKVFYHYLINMVSIKILSLTFSLQKPKCAPLNVLDTFLFSRRFINVSSINVDNCAVQPYAIIWMKFYGGVFKS